MSVLSPGLPRFDCRVRYIPTGARLLIPRIKGNLQVRLFERLRDEDNALIILPTIDKIISVRDFSTQSSNRNNIHWFTAESSTAFTFDVIVQYLDPDQPCGRDYVDPLNAQKLGDGSLPVQRLLQEDAENMYGGSDHH